MSGAQKERAAGKEMRRGNGAEGVATELRLAQSALAERACGESVIGKTAGQIWQCLHDTDGSEMPSASVARRIGGARTAFERAVGWLAREDKICFGESGQGETLRLK